MPEPTDTAPTSDEIVDELDTEEPLDEEEDEDEVEDEDTRDEEPD